MCVTLVHLTWLLPSRQSLTWTLNQCVSNKCYLPPFMTHHVYVHTGCFQTSKKMDWCHSLLWLRGQMPLFDRNQSDEDIALPCIHPTPSTRAIRSWVSTHPPLGTWPPWATVQASCVPPRHHLWNLRIDTGVYSVLSAGNWHVWLMSARPQCNVPNWRHCTDSALESPWKQGRTQLPWRPLVVFS